MGQHIVAYRFCPYQSSSVVSGVVAVSRSVNVERFYVNICREDHKSSTTFTFVSSQHNSSKKFEGLDMLDLTPEQFD